MDIRGQDQAYKRGLVLGLTMAEIVILVLFCLLLALAAVFAERLAQQPTIERQQGRIAELEKLVQVHPEELRLVAVLKEYWERHAPKNVEFREYFTRLVLQVEELSRLRAELEQLVEKNRRLEDRAKNAEDVAQALRDEGIDIRTPGGRDRLKALLKGSGSHDWPPIITLSEANNYYFNVGSAELTPSFIRQLTTQVVPKLLEIVSKYKVTVVEVVGHTDEQPIAPRPSNLDSGLRRVLDEGGSISELIPADNAGLGLVRAVSVAQVLSSDARLSGLVVLPLSGGQLIDEDRITDWKRGGDVAARRRIDIRVRRPFVRLEMETQGR